MTDAGGRPSLVVETGDYGSLGREVAAIRDSVFVRGMDVPEEIEHDDRDHFCVHVLIRADDLPAATGRLDVDRDGKVGRVAVLAPYRGMGLGTRVMDELEDLAARYGLDRVWCHAQRTAEGFYRRRGWQTVSGEFMEAGIPHVRMEKELSPDGNGGVSQ